MLPYPDDMPSSFSQSAGLLAISDPVLFKLWQPIGLIALRVCCMFRAPMPEAAIDENGDLGVGEDDVDRDTFDSSLKPKT